MGYGRQIQMLRINKSPSSSSSWKFIIVHHKIIRNAFDSAQFRCVVMLFINKWLTQLWHLHHEFVSRLLIQRKDEREKTHTQRTWYCSNFLVLSHTKCETFDIYTDAIASFGYQWNVAATAYEIRCWWTFPCGLCGFELVIISMMMVPNIVIEIHWFDWDFFAIRLRNSFSNNNYAAVVTAGNDK